MTSKGGWNYGEGTGERNFLAGEWVRGSAGPESGRESAAAGLDWGEEGSLVEAQELELWLQRLEVTGLCSG